MNLSQVDLSLLVALDALLQTSNLTHAGRRMGYDFAVTLAVDQ